MFIDKATIAYDNELQVSQETESSLALRQRFDHNDEWSGPVWLGPDELREIVRIAKLLGWEDF